MHATADAQLLPALHQRAARHQQAVRTDVTLSPTNPKCQKAFCGYDCAIGGRNRRMLWRDAYHVDFDLYAQGEYAGPARLAHMHEYRVRVGDTIQFTYVVSREISGEAYRIGVGDQLMIESQFDEDLNRGTLERGIEVQTDGTISVRLIGSVHAAGLTFVQLKHLLNQKYSGLYKKPGIDVSPVRTNVRNEDIRNAIGGAGGFTEQSVERIVTPDGRITLPRVGEVWVQGLTIADIKREINLHYQSLVTGLAVEVALQAQAPHFVTVLGEANVAGRFEMTAPTTVFDAIGLAQGHRVGANLKQIVVLRRADDWRLISTVVDIRQAVLGKDPLPQDAIWLRDGDVVIIPSSPIQRFDNFVSLVFTQGIYGVIPFQGFDLVEAVNGFEIDNDN